MTATNEALSDLLNLMQAGMRISVTFDFGANDQYAFSTSYIGAKPGQFLIIELPVKVKEALIMRQLKNVDVVIRAITNTKLGHIVALKSSVASVISQPAHLVFVRMPSHFASKPIREHERFSIESPVEVTCNSVSYKGKMLDFSASGCAIYISGENELTTNSVIEVESELDEHIPEDLKYSIIKINRENGGHRLGIQFNKPIELDDDRKRVLLELSHGSTKF